MKNLFERLKPILIGLAVVAVIIIGTWQMLKEDTYVISALGMDDVGREVFCQMLNGAPGDADDVRILCKGFHNEEIVVNMKNSAPIIFGTIKPSDVITQMAKPYPIALEGLSGLVLRGDESAKSVGDPVPIREVIKKLDSLGVKNIGDFYAACGFDKFIIRDEEANTNYLELTFSGQHYGSNPIQVKE